MSASLPPLRFHRFAQRRAEQKHDDDPADQAAPPVFAWRCANSRQARRKTSDSVNVSSAATLRITAMSSLFAWKVTRSKSRLFLPPRRAFLTGFATFKYLRVKQYANSIRLSIDFAATAINNDGLPRQRRRRAATRDERRNLSRFATRVIRTGRAHHPSAYPNGIDLGSSLDCADCH